MISELRSDHNNGDGDNNDDDNNDQLLSHKNVPC
jgi:hypothetical protein